MKIIFLSGLLTFAATLLIGCDNAQEAGKETWIDGTGALNLQTPTTESEVDIPIIYTKAGEVSFGMKPETFPIYIYEEDGTSVVKSFPSFAALREAGTPLVLPVGEYVIKACSFAPTEGVSEKPYFEGSSTFSIEEKTVLNTSVSCTFQSLGVELRLSDRFNKLLEEQPDNYNYSVVVSNEVAQWAFDKKNMKPGYFLKECDQLITKVIVKMAGQTYPERTWYFKNNENSPQLGEYYIITLDAGKNETKMLSCELNKEQKK